MATDSTGERLKRLRTAAGWSQEALAMLVNERQGSTWQQATIWKIENDRRPLTLGDLEALADVFGMSIEEMLYADLTDLPMGSPGPVLPPGQGHVLRPGQSSVLRSRRRPPSHQLRLDAATGRVTALQFEVQALRVRLAEVEAEYARALAEMGRVTEDIDTTEGDR